ncbi:MAG: hypothetical protein KA482_07560 [Sphingobium sp.]|nr:hypothetical protein [Sphingobium sp.]MBP8672326.1 hypothetical protein [Sphingobium sp.]MBP9156966.1 hypothetical protein [Sphingobium sp.]
MGRAPHFESVILAMKRGDMIPLIEYLRKCEGEVHHRLIRAMIDAEWEVRHRSLIGGHFKRCNAQMKPLWEDAKALLVANIERRLPTVTDGLANILEGLPTTSGLTRIMIKPRDGLTNKKHSVDWLDETRIALFLAQFVEQEGRLTKQTIYEASRRFGLSRAQLYRIWSRRREGALSFRKAYLRTQRKRFIKVLPITKRARRYPVFED